MARLGLHARSSMGGGPHLVRVGVGVGVGVRVRVRVWVRRSSMGRWAAHEDVAVLVRVRVRVRVKHGPHMKT